MSTEEDPATMTMPPLPDSPAPIVEPPNEVLQRDEGEERGPPAATRQRRSIIEGALGGEDARQEVQAAAAESRIVQDALQGFRETNPGGYFDVWRLGPSNLPSEERGKIEKIKVMELRGGKSIEDLVRDRFGGGEYEIIGRRSGHQVVAGATLSLTLGGSSKMLTPEGKAWKRKMEKAELGEERRPKDEDATGAMDKLVDALIAKRAPGEEKSGTDTLFAMIQQMNKENEDRRREDRERQDRKDKEDREAREKREKTEESERKERADREKEERDSRAARLEAQLKADAAERDRRFQLELENIKAANAERLKAMEMNAGGGLGLEGVKKIRESLAEILLDEVKDRAGGGDGDTPDDWGGVIRKVLSDHGGDLASKFLDVVREGRAAQPPRRAAPPARVLPAPATPAVDAEVETAAGGETAASNAPEASFLRMKDIADKKNQIRLTSFLELLGSELLAQSDPEEAWDTPQDDTQITLRDLYFSLAEPWRVAFAVGWPEFKGAVPKAVASQVAIIDGMIGKYAKAASWLGDFMATVPTHDEDGGDEPEAEETPDAEPDTPAAPGDEPRPGAGGDNPLA